MHLAEPLTFTYSGYCERMEGVGSDFVFIMELECGGVIVLRSTANEGEGEKILELQCEALMGERKRGWREVGGGGGAAENKGELSE